MNYTLHQLRVFSKVNELQSVTKAAEELHLTQPAVSIQVKKLQDQFELPLIEHVGRQLYVTDFGKDIATRAKHILKEAEEIKHSVARYKGILAGNIKISVVSTGKYVMPFFLKSFMDKYPGIDISLDVSNKNRVMRKLMKNESDFSLVSVVPDDVQVHMVELMDNELYLMGRTESRFDVEKPADLSNYTLLFREQGSATRNAMEKFLEKHKVQVNKSMELVSNEAIKQALLAGLGLSIVPLIGARGALKDNRLSTFPLKGLPMRTKWNMIYSKGKNLTPAQLALVDHFKEHRAQITKEFFN